jgi:hypothetical protein
MIDEVFASSPVPRFTADKKALVATNGYAYGLVLPPKHEALF